MARIAWPRMVLPLFLAVCVPAIKGLAAFSRARLALQLAPPRMVASQLAPAAEPLVQVLCAAGLSEEEAHAIWNRRPQGRLPSVAQQATLIEWLERDALSGTSKHPARLLYMAMHGSPKLMLRAGKIPQLKASLGAVRSALKNLNQRQLALTLAHNPEILLLSPADVESRSANLQKVASLDTTELSVALSSAPRLLLLAPEQLKSRAKWLRSRFNMKEGQLRRMVSNAPLTMVVKTRSIESRVSVLASLGLDDDLIKLLIVRSPRIVHFHKNEILARIQWLRDSGVVRDDEELRQWLRKEPDFFNVPISVCEARIDWLSGVCAGNGSCDAKGGAAMLRAEPRILTQQSQALQLRAELWESMLGGSPSELVRVPHLFTCNLARTVMLRKAYCLLSGIEVEPVDLLVKDISTFCTEIAGCTEQELREFEKEGNHIRLFSAL